MENCSWLTCDRLALLIASRCPSYCDWFVYGWKEFLEGAARSTEIGPMLAS